MDSENKRNHAKLVQEIARIKGYRGKVFTIGPFGTRVGFAFQQSRALNLVAALAQEGDMFVPRSSQIAIVGGGISGVTALVALSGFGYSHVNLFEENKEPLWLQGDATHRLVHPSYNRWPVADGFSAATDFPFLNWFAGSASSVLEMMRSEWSDILRLRCSIPALYCRVERISNVAKEDKVKIKYFNRRDSCSEERNFDVVIFATGFGKEKNLEHSDTQSYWAPKDAISVRRDEPEFKRFLVSGIGDGGLIDCLRLGFKEGELNEVFTSIIGMLRAEEFKVRLSKVVDDENSSQSQIETEIKTAEDNAANLLGEVSRRVKFGTKLENSVSEDLAHFYRNLVHDLDGGILKVLDKCIDKDKGSAKALGIKFVGRLSQPFDTRTAPINKLLLAYLMEFAGLSYEQAVIDFDTEPPEVVYRKDDNSREKISDYDCKTLRHGSEPPIQSIAPSFNDSAAREVATLADWTSIFANPTSFTDAIRKHVCADPTSELYFSTRQVLIGQYASKFFGKDVEIKLKKKGDNSGLVCFVTSTIDNNDMLENSYLATGGFDRRIFGVNVVHEPTPPQLIATEDRLSR